MKYIPADVFDYVSSNLDIVSIVQLGKVCKDTKFLTSKAMNVLSEMSNSNTNNILSEMAIAYDMLTQPLNKKDICKKITTKVLQSELSSMIINTMHKFYYEMTGDMIAMDVIETMLDKVDKDQILTEREQNMWELFEQFWLGNRFYISVFVSNVKTNSDVLIQMQSKGLVEITTLKNKHETQSQHFGINDVQDIVSFIWENCGKKFFMDTSGTTCQVIREYNVAKTPNSFDRWYNIYLHMKDVQHPFYQVAEKMTKNIMH